MVGQELYEARRWELQLLNAIRFASLVIPTTRKRCSVLSATATPPLRLDPPRPVVQKISGKISEDDNDYPHEVTFSPI